MAIDLPDFERCFDYENNFYLACHPGRLAKCLAHYHLYKMAVDKPGDLVECGVFKGSSLVRWAKFRALFACASSQKIIGFDTFESFPETSFQPDVERRLRFIQAAGDQSISVDQLWEVLRHHGLEANVELVKGDIRTTLPEYVQSNPQLRISMLVVDVDLYEPTKAAMEHLYSRLVKGGVLVLDDYGSFAGANKAIEEFFAGRNEHLQKFPFAATPTFMIKD